GADPAWFLGACAVPLAILPLVVPLRVRALLTAAVALALAAGYVAVQPAMLGEPGVLGPMLTLVTVGATGVLLGEHYYRLVRSHHRQRVHMQALIADGTRRLRQLLTEVERAEQAERRRIGRELHDELAQVLTALKLEVELATYKVEPGTATAASLGRIDALSDQLVEAKQRLVHALRPATLDELGFGRAVERHVADVTARSGLTIELDRAAGVELPEPAATTIYRGLQEALTNTIRHACATTARIRIAVDDGAYLLEVRDDGIGFDPDAVGAGHFGLLGLRERAAILGGTVAVVSAPGRGTQVTVRLPADATPPA
ncbi:MAG: sensor histidine kinase, partial [Myxococcales bacterium]|nr:sensor histidine kinase [Myxococcales bacterium]